jgi:hypothetical protein
VQVLTQETHAVPLQYLDDPHEVGAANARHPFASAVQVCTCAPEHCVAPACKQVLLQLGLEDPPQQSNSVLAANHSAAFMAAPCVLKTRSA